MKRSLQNLASSAMTHGLLAAAADPSSYFGKTHISLQTLFPHLRSGVKIPSLRSGSATKKGPGRMHQECTGRAEYHDKEGLPWLTAGSKIRRKAHFHAIGLRG